MPTAQQNQITEISYINCTCNPIFFNANENLPVIHALGIGSGGRILLDHISSDYSERAEFKGLDSTVRQSFRSLSFGTDYSERDEFKDVNTTVRELFRGSITHTSQLSSDVIAKNNDTKSINRKVIRDFLDGSDMVLVITDLDCVTDIKTAVFVAEIANDTDALTVAIVIPPLSRMGIQELQLADLGLKSLSAFADTVIPLHQETMLPSIYELQDLFEVSNNLVLRAVLRCIVVCTRKNFTGLDLAGVKSLLDNSGISYSCITVHTGINEERIRGIFIKDTDYSKFRGCSITILDTSIIMRRDYHKILGISYRWLPEGVTEIASSISDDIKEGLGVIVAFADGTNHDQRGHFQSHYLFKYMDD